MTTREPRWWSELQARAVQPSPTPRRALLLDGIDAPIGSIEPGLAELLRTAGLPLEPEGEAERIGGAPDAALARIAHWLHAQGRCGKWRGELLAVTDAAGKRHAAIERAAVRPLGITTFAVHLIGFSAAGGVWVQQRAFDKATDPGRWDTLVGGLVAADEAAPLALERETWEEAGLRTSALQSLAKADRITIRRPVREGYMVEHADVFEAVVPAGLTPLNQDGEVARFECVPAAALAARIAAGEFTLEAGVMLARCLARRGLLEA